MKKTITFIAMNLVAAASIAGNSYCDNRQTQRDVVRCYQNAVSVQNNLINQNLNKIYASNKLSDNDKRKVQASMDAWYDWLNQSCHDNACAYDAMVQRRNVVIQYYNQNAK